MRYSQQRKIEFIRMCDELRRLRASGLTSNEAMRDFVDLSIRVQVAKASVPKRLWSLATKD